jgi:hypothetical protein
MLRYRKILLINGVEPSRMQASSKQEVSNKRCSKAAHTQLTTTPNTIQTKQCVHEMRVNTKRANIALAHTGKLPTEKINLKPILSAKFLKVTQITII